MAWLYLGGLLFSLAGLTTLDWRHKLAFWHDARRTALTIGSAVAIFIVWDLLGVGLGIFYHGGSALTLPLRIAPEFPVEELFFLALLCYVTLLIYRALTR